MGSTRKGMLNVLIAAVLWGSSGVCAQYIMEQSQMSSQFLTMFRNCCSCNSNTTYPSTLIARYGTLPVVGWSMLIGGLILLPFYARQGTNFVVNGSLILAFFYLVVIGTSLTFSLYLKGAQLIGGPKASILSCAEPLSSALLSLLLLGITFTLPDWLGTLLILSSVILISMDSRRRARKINRPARHE